MCRLIQLQMLVFVLSYGYDMSVTSSFIVDQSNIVYATRGEPAVIKCRVKTDGITVSWRIYDSDRHSNFTPLADETTINPNVKNSEKMAIIGDISAGQYSLLINNVSSYDEGLYICVELQSNFFAQQTVFELKLKVPPSNITIWNVSEGNILIGRENQHMQLICSVKSGIPEEDIAWFNESSIIQKGGPGILNTTILPHKSDNKKQYYCEVTSEALLKPLRKNITLNIQYAPDLIFFTNETTIIEGGNVSLYCFVDANPAVTNFSMVKSGNAIDTFVKDSILVSRLININRTDKGVSCKAANTMGKVSSNIYINVSYPPNVNVNLKTCNDDSLSYCLRCTATGFPMNYSSPKWIHRSEHNEFIRSIKEDINGTVTIPKGNFSLPLYQNNGYYICRMSNGIHDAKGNFYQEGVQRIAIDGRPVFMDKNKRKMFGKYGTIIGLSVYVLSKPKPNDCSISKTGSTENSQKMNVTNIEEVKIPDIVHGVSITVSALKLTFILDLSTGDRFGCFTVTVCNTFGCNGFVIEIILKDIYERDVKSLFWIVLGPLIGTIVILICSHVVCCHRRRHSSTDTIIQTQQQPQYDEIGTINYNIVNIMPLQSPPTNENTRRPYDETGSSSSSSSGVADGLETAIGDGYENPYQPLQVYSVSQHNYQDINNCLASLSDISTENKEDTDIESSHFEQIGNKNDMQSEDEKISNSSDQSIMFGNIDGYEHPYQPLQREFSESDTYNTCSIEMHVWNDNTKDDI